MYYPCSENKGADQLGAYRTADLRLCFHICKKRFSCGVAQYIRIDNLHILWYRKTFDSSLLKHYCICFGYIKNISVVVLRVL